MGSEFDVNPPKGSIRVNTAPQIISTAGFFAGSTSGQLIFPRVPVVELEWPPQPATAEGHPTSGLFLRTRAIRPPLRSQELKRRDGSPNGYPLSNLLTCSDLPVFVLPLCQIRPRAPRWANRGGCGRLESPLPGNLSTVIRTCERINKRGLSMSPQIGRDFVVSGIPCCEPVRPLPSTE